MSLNDDTDDGMTFVPGGPEEDDESKDMKDPEDGMEDEEDEWA